ncbi:unnamed protein product [Linum tenue]|uniref:Kazal-like domain-containing protein n=1 Tax=Linum tenue TaxID=586396 RepID=A0AAV0PHC2_9ROSI|nr:unnamed protein product [Linum tenue]
MATSASFRQQMALALVLTLALSLSVLPSTVESSWWRHSVDGDVCRGMSDPDPESCPVSCLISDPVCGADGYTYWCGCQDAMCSGTHVVRSGEC